MTPLPWRKAVPAKPPLGLYSKFVKCPAEIHGITGCVITADTGQVELRFTRLKTDGSFMPPEQRVSVYQVRRFDDGWRATSMAGLPAGESMKCPE